MTPSDLKRLHERNGGEHFFSRCNMRFAGDTMGNFRVRMGDVEDTLHAGECKRPDMAAWCLYRAKATRCGVGFVKAFDDRGQILTGYTPKN